MACSRRSECVAYIEHSPCPTGYRCQDLLDQQLPVGSEISYFHPWQPTNVQDASRTNLRNDIARYFEQNRDGHDDLLRVRSRCHR